MDKNKNSTFIKGALILTVGVVISKIFSGIYRIPLTNMLGAYGIGVYQLIFPIYAFLITIFGVGIPNALSKMIAVESASSVNSVNKERKILKSAFFLLLGLGLTASVGLFLFAPMLSRMQNCAETQTAYKIIAPSLLFVCISSSLKGYFQGKMHMSPSALAQIFEQTTKLVLGLIFVYISLPDIIKAVYSAVIAILISEIVSLAVLTVSYFVYKNKQKTLNNCQITHFFDDKTESSGIVKKLIVWAIPMTLSSAINPLSHIIESLMVQNLIENATRSYGLWSGPVHSLLSLPPVLIMGICVCILPSITQAVAKKQPHVLNEQFNIAFKWICVIGLPSSLAFLLFSRPVLTLLYSGLSAEEIEISAKMLSMTAFSVLTSSIVFLSIAVFNGMGKLYLPVIVLVSSNTLKACVDYVLLTSTNLNIYAVSITSMAFSLISCVVVLIIAVKNAKIRIDWWDSMVKPLSASAVMSLALTVIVSFKKNTFTNFETVTSITILIAVFLIALYVVDKKYIKSIFNRPENNEIN